MPPKRSLFLHLSALSDAEYSEYVQALRDILDDVDKPSMRISDDELENKKVALPVVRAWMKGRFRDLGSSEIDKVLHLFVLQMPQNEMSGGQLLAALRLLMHARRGGEIYEGSVFIQAEPSSPIVPRHPANSTNVRSVFELEPPTMDAPPSSPKFESAHLNPFFGSNSSVYQPDAATPKPSNHIDADSPRRASLSSTPSGHPTLSKPRAAGVGVPPGSTNPFLQRAKTHSGTYEPNSGSGRTPPLPPRKPAHISSSSISPRPPPLPAKPPYTVPSHPATSSNSVSSSSSSMKDSSPPPIPPHRVTPLMQQSLLASRVGASLKRAQEEAGRTRVLEVIRSSSDILVPRNLSKDRGRTQSSSPEKGARRPVPQPPRATHIPIAKSDSGAPSVASLEEVASAQLTRLNIQSRSESRDLSPSPSDEEHSTSKCAHTSAEQFSPPPTHPARRPSVHSSSRSRHLRSPSFQTYNSQYTPSGSGGASSINKSVSTAGFCDELHQSSLPSPLPSTVSSPQVRPTRSQSLRQPPSPSTFSQPSDSGAPFLAQRKRPESAQFASRPRLLDPDHRADADVDGTSPFANTFSIRRGDGEGTGGAVSSIAARFEHRGTDKERNRDKDLDREPNAFASFQRTFSAFQQRAQPAITRARFKAEAGFLAPRRGFLPNGRDYHLAGEGGDRLVSQNNTGDDGDMDLTPTTDQDDDENVEGGHSLGRTRGEDAKECLTQRDNLKLPEGEGWTRL